MLELKGHDVRTVFDGRGAVDVAEAYRPDVILLDIGMPGIDGYEACHRIRAREWSKSTKIVALTGWGQAEDRRRSSEAGFNRHVVKPIDPAQLTDVIS